MSAFAITPPFPIFTGLDGDALDNGKIYVGVANLNPVTNPVALYWDDALSIAATQPIRTSGGYAVRNGTPSLFYAAVDTVSITVTDSVDVPVYTAPEVSDLAAALSGSGGSALIGFIQAGTGAVARTAQAKMRDAFHVNDFGAVADRSPSNLPGTDNTAAFNLAIAAALAAGRRLEIGAGNYYVSTALTPIVLPSSAALRGDGTTMSIYGAGSGSSVITYAGSGDLFDVSITDNFTPFNVEGVRIQRALTTFASIPAGSAIKLSGLYGFRVQDVVVTYFDTAVELAGSLAGTIDGLWAGWCLQGVRGYTEAGISPNQIAIRNTKVVNTRDYGVWFTDGTGLTLDSVTVEGGGDAANAIFMVPLFLETCGKDGGIAITCTGANYFEANNAEYSAYITHAYECSYQLTNCLFNRANVADTVINDILFNANALGAGVSPATLQVQGSSFNSINGDVRDPLEPRIAVLATGGYDQLTVFTEGATGLDRVDAPVFADDVRLVSPAKRRAARIRFTGAASPVILETDNVLTLGRNSVGNYNIMFIRPLKADAYTGQLVAFSSDCTMKIVNETIVSGGLTVVNIVTHIGGVATDCEGIITFDGDTL